MASIEVNGAQVLSRDNSPEMSISTESNIITVVVTAEDGVTQKTYVVNVRRISVDLLLSGLSISYSDLVPDFSSTLFEYQCDMAYSIDFVRVTPTLYNPQSSLTVNGTQVASDSASEAISLNIGDNYITIVVSSGNGAADTTYHVNVIRDRNMKYIPGGTFQMGSTTGHSDEKPVHTVSVSSFWMDKTEVTQSEYSTLMASTYPGFSAPFWNSSYGKGSNYPAYYVNWYDAVLYCNARSKRDGLDTVYSYTSIKDIPGNDCKLEGLFIDLSKEGFRLPTEAEWEYAARAGTTTEYYWGNDSVEATVKQYAWYKKNALEKYWTTPHAEKEGTQPVATKLSNGFGLYDMSGNLWEWCNDWYERAYYASSLESDPVGPSSGWTRVMRGGSWFRNVAYLRLAFRNGNSPNGGFYYGSGFRVVLPE